MVVKMVRGLFKLGFYAGGLAAVVGTWDYTQQAKAAEYDYSFDKYKLSVMDRYGDEAGYAFSALDTAKSGAQAGMQWVSESGLLEKVGLDMPAPIAAEEGQPVELVFEIERGSTSKTIQLASAAQVLAPETSLYPRARALP